MGFGLALTQAQAEANVHQAENDILSAKSAINALNTSIDLQLSKEINELREKELRMFQMLFGPEYNITDWDTGLKMLRQKVDEVNQYFQNFSQENLYTKVIEPYKKAIQWKKDSNIKFIDKEDAKMKMKLDKLMSYFANSAEFQTTIDNLMQIKGNNLLNIMSQIITEGLAIDKGIHQIIYIDIWNGDISINSKGKSGQKSNFTKFFEKQNLGNNIENLFKNISLSELAGTTRGKNGTQSMQQIMYNFIEQNYQKFGLEWTDIDEANLDIQVQQQEQSIQNGIRDSFYFSITKGMRPGEIKGQTTLAENQKEAIQAVKNSNALLIRQIAQLIEGPDAAKIAQKFEDMAIQYINKSPKDTFLYGLFVGENASDIIGLFGELKSSFILQQFPGMSPDMVKWTAQELNQQGQQLHADILLTNALGETFGAQVKNSAQSGNTFDIPFGSINDIEFNAMLNNTPNLQIVKDVLNETNQMYVFNIEYDTICQGPKLTYFAAANNEFSGTRRSIELAKQQADTLISLAATALMHMQVAANVDANSLYFIVNMVKTASEILSNIQKQIWDPSINSLRIKWEEGKGNMDNIVDYKNNIAKGNARHGNAKWVAYSSYAFKRDY